jgi:protein-L-isoaspartate(D-aspartate) O-methyltransferase
VHADIEPEAFAQERERMVASQLRARGLRDQRVLAAMAHVPRHEFVPSDFRSQAYDDHPLPIGQEQTISQPYIVALMLEYLAIEPTDSVLEIGTGSGYQTALLAELADRVYTIERHQALADSAATMLMRLGYSNVTVLVGDGSQGLPQHAPYDRIIVAAAAHAIPPALLAQLGEGGRMILPVGAEHSQELQLVRKKSGVPIISSLEGCRFVPLVAGVAERDLL